MTKTKQTNQTFLSKDWWKLKENDLSKWTLIRCFEAASTQCTCCCCTTCDDSNVIIYNNALNIMSFLCLVCLLLLCFWFLWCFDLPTFFVNYGSSFSEGVSGLCFIFGFFCLFVGWFFCSAFGTVVYLLSNNWMSMQLCALLYFYLLWIVINY